MTTNKHIKLSYKLSISSDSGQRGVKFWDYSTGHPKSCFSQLITVNSSHFLSSTLHALTATSNEGSVNLSHTLLHETANM